MKNKSYWIARSEQILIENERKSNEYLNKLNSLYKATAERIDEDIKRIFATYKKDFSEEQARVWLDEIIPKAEYEKLKAEFALITDPRYKKLALMKLNAPAYRYRISRLEQIKSLILARTSNIASAQKNLSEQCFGETIHHSYNRTMFDIQKGVGAVFEFNQLPTKTIESLLSAKWYGNNFSQRVWNNTAMVADKASEIIKEGVLAGQSIETMSKSLMERTYTQSMFNATRLIRTEVNYFSNQGSIESYKEVGLDSYEFCATLDGRTSDICQSLDGKVFPLDEAVQGENAPPMHPYCRSCIIPIINSEGIVRMNKRRARDIVTGKSIVIDKMNYREWYEKFIKSNPKAITEEIKIRNKASDKLQYQKYKSVLSKNAPKSFDKFTDLKYNDSKEYSKIELLYKDQKIRNRIRSQEVNKTIDMGKQGKHIIGHNNYIKGRSYLTITEQETQELVNKYAGAGIIDRDRKGYFTSKERITADKLIGMNINNQTGEETPTNQFYIHYSKNGTHIVPTLKGAGKI